MNNKSIIFSILYRIRSLYLFINKNKYKNKVTTLLDNSSSNYDIVYDHKKIAERLQYKDNNWNHIKNINLLMWNDIFNFFESFQYKGEEIIDNLCIERKIIRSNNQIICKVCDGIPNEWIFLLIPNESDNYEFNFKARIKTINKEFQIAFNYESIGRRYRFNLVDNKILNFDIIEGGMFYNRLNSCPYSLKIGEIHSFTLRVNKNKFKYIIDDNEIMSIELNTKNILKGDIALILWNSTPNPIDVIYEDLQLKVVK